MEWEWVFYFSFLGVIGCAGGSGAHKEEAKMISNPFANFDQSKNPGKAANVILRTKKGDHSLELELPAGSHDLSDFVIPVSPEFQDFGDNRSLASLSSASLMVDDSYRDFDVGVTDRELLSNMQKNDPMDLKRHAIESNLNLTSAASTDPAQKSYLSKVDKIKQLYRLARFEAALLELDGMVKSYPMDPKLYEMRGTLLDRIGRFELALKSWNQALELDPQNIKLKKFVENKQAGK